MTRNPVIRSSLWTFGGFGFGQILRLASNLIMTRLLAPEAFGLMALVVIFLVGLELFTDLGIGASVIQNKRGEEEDFFNTAWTIKVIRGFFIFICVCLITAPAAWFYQEPQLLKILPVMGFGVLFSGFASSAPSLANRKLWVGRITVMNLASQFLSLAVTVIWAWFSPTVWAIVAGNLVSGLLRAALSHVIFPFWRVRFRWDPHMAREIIRFGKWIFVASALTFVAGQIDRLTLAKLMPFHLVGIYSIGFMWAALPLQVVQTWCGSVLFPLASETLRSPENTRHRLTVYRRLVVWVSALGIGIFGGIAAPVFHLLYTPAYWSAATFLGLLLIGSFLKILDELYKPFNLAAGQPIFMSVGSGISLLMFLIAVYPLYELYSARGIAMAYSISQLGSLLANAVGVRRTGLADLRVDAAALFTTLAIWAGIHFTIGKLI